MADEVGVDVWREQINYKRAAYGEGMLQTWGEKADEANGKLIPFPDFLAKLRGVEVWTPKAGEMVEVSIGGENWVAREFIGERKELYWAWYEDRPNSYSHCRPLSPTITRAEAEQQLGKRIID